MAGRFWSDTVDALKTMVLEGTYVVMWGWVLQEPRQRGVEGTRSAEGLLHTCSVTRLELVADSESHEKHFVPQRESLSCITYPSACFFSIIYHLLSSSPWTGGFLRPGNSSYPCLLSI